MNPNAPILFDHEWDTNTGNRAMVEGAVRLLRKTFPGREIHCVAHPSTEGLRGEPGVRLVAPFFLVSPGGNLFPSNGLHSKRSGGLRGWWMSCLRGLSRHPVLWKGFSLVRRQQLRAARRTWRALEREGAAALRVAIREEGGTRLVSLPDFISPYAMLVTGGCPLTDQFVPSLERHCAFLEAFASEGKPVFLAGKQWGPFESEELARVVGRYARRAALIGVREPTHSVEFLGRHGVPSECLALVGDDSLGLEPASPDEVDPWLHRLGLRRGEFLALNVRIGFYAPAMRRHLRRVAALADALSRSTGLPWLYVPIARNPWDDDARWGRRLAFLARASDIRFLPPEADTPSLVKGVLGAAHGAVGNSYHFCTFALTRGVPAVCLHTGSHYSQKGAGLRALWQRPELALPLDGCRPAEGARSLSRLFGDPGLRPALSARARELEDGWWSVLTERLGRLLPA